jgi:hopene-associated glycosyltransferase HpnB
MGWGTTIPAGVSLAIWLYLVALRGGFWRADRRLDADPPAPGAWPAVVALVPARDEAAGIGRAIASLLAQDYPGPLRVVLADDHSVDGTAQIARRAAEIAGQAERFYVVAARPLPAGWSGKPWALNEALARAAAVAPEAAYLWLSDADIEHGPATLRGLVAKAEAERLNLVSLMVALSCRGFWERLLIPPFVYFFQMLYPFPWVNDPRRGAAAAAGGCMLLRRDALARAGGFAAIKGELIDDCALARRIKELPPSEGGADGARGLWLGLATTSRSIRPYRGLDDIWRMVARSAYTQLRHSPRLLLGTLSGLAVTFLVPPLVGLTAGLHGDNLAAIIGFATWSLMAVSAVPTYRLYRQPVWLATFLPLAASFYGAMTLDSALRHWRGRGGAWKGRTQPGAREVAQKPREL